MVMLVLVCLFVLAMVLSIGGSRYVIRNNILKSAANNYARFTAQQIANLVGTLDDPSYWQFDEDGLSAVLTRVSRTRGITKIQNLQNSSYY